MISLRKMLCLSLTFFLSSSSRFVILVMLAGPACYATMQIDCGSRLATASQVR